MDVSKSIIKGLVEAVEYEKGNKSKARSNTIKIADLPQFHGNQIRDIRVNLQLSQNAFAKAIGVSAKTVESWEADRNIPNGPAQRLLNMIKKDKNFLRSNYILME